MTDEERSFHFLVYVGRTLLRDCASGEGFSKFARYETNLNNQLAKTLKMLSELRAVESSLRRSLRLAPFRLPQVALGSNDCFSQSLNRLARNCIRSVYPA